MAELHYDTTTQYMLYTANKKLAEAYLENDFNALYTQAEQDDWKANSQFNDAFGEDDSTGLFEYKDYYMGSFGSGTNSNVTLFNTTSLAAGIDNMYANRANRTWTTT